MIYLGWAVIFFLLFLAFLINQTVVASIEKMSKPEGLFKRVEQVNDEGFLVQFKTFDEWATKNAFVHDCLFLSHTVLDNSAIQCSAWWSQRDAAWALMYYYKGKCIYDFVTKLNDKNSITTASAKDALTLPATSGSYRQAFTGLSLDALYQKHQACCYVA